MFNGENACRGCFRAASSLTPVRVKEHGERHIGLCDIHSTDWKRAASEVTGGHDS